MNLPSHYHKRQQNGRRAKADVCGLQRNGNEFC